MLWFFLALLPLFFVLIQLQALWQEFSRLLHLRLWSPLIAVLPAETRLPLHPLLKAASKEMAACGFIHLHTRRCRALIFSSQDLPQWVDVYYHPQRDVHALVHVASSPHTEQCYEVELQNYFIDGSVLLTVWRGSARLLLLPRNSHLVRAHAPDVHNLLQAHLRRRAHVASVRTHAADALSLASSWGERLLLCLAQQGQVVRTRRRHQQRDLFRLSLMQAARLAWRHTHAEWVRRRSSWRLPSFMQPRQAINAGPAPSDKNHVDLLQLAQQHQWLHAWAQANSRQRPLWLLRLPLLFLSLACLPLAFWLGGPPALMAASAVLACHFLVLSLRRAWPYRARHPLLHMAGLLAAPLFGIVLALTLLLALVQGWLSPGKHWWWWVVFGIGFNVLQLLPWRPFLGAHILQWLFPWAWPRLVLCALLCGLCVLAAWLAERYWLLLPAIWFAAYCPSLWQQCRAQILWRRLRRSHRVQHPAQLASNQLFSALASLRYCQASTRLHLLRSLAQPHPKRPMSATACLFGLCLYLGSALLPGLGGASLLLAYPSQTLALWQQAQTHETRTPEAQAGKPIKHMVLKHQEVRAQTKGASAKQ